MSDLRASFLLRLPNKTREAVRDHAKQENVSQNSLIQEALTTYLVTPPDGG